MRAYSGCSTDLLARILLRRVKDSSRCPPMQEKKLGDLLVKTGGILAIVVTVVLLVSLVVRPTAPINPLNLATLAMASLAGAMALAATRRTLVLVIANLLMLMATVPTIFGWIWLLYFPPLLILFLGSLVVAKPASYCTLRDILQRRTPWI